MYDIAVKFMWLQLLRFLCHFKAVGPINRFFWPLMGVEKSDRVAPYKLDMADLAAKSCLFTHPAVTDNISIHL